MTEQQPSAGRRAGRRSRRRAAVLAAAALVVALNGCGDDDDDDAAPADVDADAGASADAAALGGTSWTLAATSIDGQEVAAVGTATLAFVDDGTVAGSTGCNRFSGTYTQSGSELTITIGPVTRAACADPAATDQETAILANLAEVTSYATDGQLLLMDDGDATLLIYDPGLSTIEGTSWTATGVNNGREAVESTTITGTVTAEFGADGALSGFAGCNTYNATYALSDDDGISITGIATTRMACDDEAMTLETQYVTALGNASTYTLDGDTLTLRDSAGSIQVSYALAT